MIVLDTNVLSELMRPAPSEAVLRWVGGQPAASLFTTTVTQAEISALWSKRHRLTLPPESHRGYPTAR
jgi:predicted nucleic acid-binding protein